MTLEQLEARVVRLEALIGLRNAPEPELQKLLANICAVHGVPIHRVQGHSREGMFIPPRQQFCYLAILAKYPIATIAMAIRNDFNRSAVQHHASACEDRMDTDPAFLAGMRELATLNNIVLPERYRA